MRIRKREQVEIEHLQEQLQEGDADMDDADRAVVQGKLKTIRNRRKAQA